MEQLSLGWKWLLTEEEEGGWGGANVPREWFGEMS